MTPQIREVVALTASLPSSLEAMERAMRECEQTPGQSVYEHGESVAQHIRELIGFLKDELQPDTSRWRLPNWFFGYRAEIEANLGNPDELFRYALYHDCGKPFCRTTDDDGKVHFPAHAVVSEQVWLSVGGEDGIGRLIRHDMAIHTLTAAAIDDLCKEEWSVHDSLRLLLASLAEVHSNAALFGGIDSTSFKIKWKVVERRGNQILKYWFPALAGANEGR